MGGLITEDRGLRSETNPHSALRTPHSISSAFEGLAVSVGLRVSDESEVGMAGILLPKIARSLDIRGEVVVAEIDLDQLFVHAGKARATYQEISKFPSMRRDLAVVVSRGVPYSDVEGAAASSDEALLESVRAIDLFVDDSGQKLPADAKSVAISLVFRSNERTLSSDEVNAACDRIRLALKTKVQAEFR